MRITAGRLLTAADLAATCLFAIEGAIVARYADLDVFGVLVIGFVSALVGGIVRDVLIGYTPPASLRSALYPITAFAGAGLVIALSQLVEQIPVALLQFTDAAGLALFAVVGATKAIDFRINWLVAVLLGAVSAVGGGSPGTCCSTSSPGFSGRTSTRSPRWPGRRPPCWRCT